MYTILFLSLACKCLYALNCYSCSGPYDQLSNKTCSIVTQNESCLIIVSNVTGSRSWNILIDGFKEPESIDQFPYNYRKPASGNNFVEHYWFILSNTDDSYLTEIRYFCYTDLCNKFSLIDTYLNTTLYYETVDLNTPTENCLRCNGPTYDSVKNCSDISICKPCSLTANKVLNDLTVLWGWWSSCDRLSSQIFYGSIRTQFEYNTEYLNVYTSIVCYYKECYTFDFMNNFTKSVKIKF